MVSRFFINTVLGYNPDYEMVENLCLYNLKNPDIGAIRLVNDKFNPEDFADFGKFMSKLITVPELMSRIGKMNVNTFVQMYVTLYNALYQKPIDYSGPLRATCPDFESHHSGE